MSIVCWAHAHASCCSLAAFFYDFSFIVPSFVRSFFFRLSLMPQKTVLLHCKVRRATRERQMMHFSETTIIIISFGSAKDLEEDREREREKINRWHGEERPSGHIRLLSSCQCMPKMAKRESSSYPISLTNLQYIIYLLQERDLTARCELSGTSRFHTWLPVIVDQLSPHRAARENESCCLTQIMIEKKLRIQINVEQNSIFFSRSLIRWLGSGYTDRSVNIRNQQVQENPDFVQGNGRDQQCSITSWQDIDIHTVYRELRNACQEQVQSRVWRCGDITSVKCSQLFFFLMGYHGSIYRWKLRLVAK